MISSRKSSLYLHRDEISLCPEKLRNCNCTEGNVKMQYDTRKQVATQLCTNKCPCSQYCTQYGCNMRWTQDHSKVKQHFTLAHGNDTSPFYMLSYRTDTFT